MKKVLTRCYVIWSTLAVAIIHVYSPEVLLFGGGVLAREREILPAIRADVHRRRTWNVSC
jgi:glucokinase